jgi:hypothetical protein
MWKFKIAIASILLWSVTSCTSLSEGSQSDELYSDTDARVRLHVNETATLRDKMDEQASEINRKKNIEAVSPINPAMRPTDLRPEQAPHAPIEPAVHNNTEWLKPTFFRSRLILIK